MKKRAKLEDVAREAGVSTATVSYVINKNPSQTITKETVERVRLAVKKLGYIPNMAAKSLVTNQSKLIGVVIPQTEPDKEFMFSNPFYGEFLSSVEYVARKNGYHIIISGTNADENYLKIANTRNLDGIIIVGMYLDKYYTALKKTQIPIVLVDCYSQDSCFNKIQIDDRQGGYLAAKYLIEKGHRTVALITGLIKKTGVIEQRLAGYRDAILEAGMDFDTSLVYDGEVSYEYGRIAGGLLAQNPRKPSAVFVSADILAIGVVKGLRSNGLMIPRDISIIGFDDTWLSTICDPPLTAVHQDIALKGKKAVEIILGISSGRISGKQDIFLPLSITERESVRTVSRSRSVSGRIRRSSKK